MSFNISGGIEIVKEEDVTGLVGVFHETYTNAITANVEPVNNVSYKKKEKRPIIVATICWVLVPDASRTVYYEHDIGPCIVTCWNVRAWACNSCVDVVITFTAATVVAIVRIDTILITSTIVDFTFIST